MEVGGVEKIVNLLASSLVYFTVHLQIDQYIKDD